MIRHNIFYIHVKAYVSRFLLILNILIYIKYIDITQLDYSVDNNVRYGHFSRAWRKESKFYV